MLQSQPDFDGRFKKSLLRLGEPDRVPLGELGISPNIKEAYLGRPILTVKDDIDFFAAAGYDYIKLSAKIDMNPGKVLSEGGQKTTQRTDGQGERKWASEGKGVITSWEDFEKYQFADPKDCDWSHFEEAIRELPDGMKIVAHYGDIFTFIWELMGFENFSFAMIDNLDLIKALYEKIGEIIFSLFKTMADFEKVGAMWFSDDLAYTGGLMVSPLHFREFLFPWVKKIGEINHEFK